MELNFVFVVALLAFHLAVTGLYTACVVASRKYLDIIAIVGGIFWAVLLAVVLILCLQRDLDPALWVMMIMVACMEVLAAFVVVRHLFKWL